LCLEIGGESMSSKFGILSKLTFLQDLASSFIASIDGAIVHNIEKYLALNRIFYYAAVEGIQGDYLEFGIYTGSSFVCAIKCCKNNFKYISTPPPPPSIHRAKKQGRNPVFWV
jgi:hypothetical protein